MEALMLILGLMFLVCAAAGVYAVVRTVRAAKRGIDRTVNQARRTVEDTRLRARQLTQHGVQSELAALRLALRTSMRSTQDTLHAAVGQDQSLSEALQLFGRLSAHGHELDDDLRRLEREPDRAGIAQVLPTLRERTERITRSADSLRWAARDRAHRFASDDLTALDRDIELEAGALRHWTTEPGPRPETEERPRPVAEERPRPAVGEWPRPAVGEWSGPVAEEWPPPAAEERPRGFPAPGKEPGKTL